MATVITDLLPEAATVGDLLTHLGDIPPHRIRLRPTPGTATKRTSWTPNDSPAASVS